MEEMTTPVSRMSTAFLDMHATTTISGPKLPVPRSNALHARLWYTRPDRVYFTMEGAVNLAAITDGKQVMLYSPTTKQYSIEPVGADQKPEDVVGPMLMSLGIFPMYQFSTAELRRQMLASVLEQPLEEAGRKQIANTPVRHVRVGAGDTALDVFVADTPQGQLPIYTVNRTPLGEMKLLQETSIRWVPNQQIPAETYAFTPPVGAQKVPAQQFLAGLARAASPGLSDKQPLQPAKSPATRP